MPRFPRIHYPGAVYHAMARGVDGRTIFIDDDDRRNFLRIALRLKAESGCSILAYCLMGNHFHLAIKVAGTPLSAVMHRLLTIYVLGFNAQYSREGHLFQARYKSFLCRDDTYLLALVRYIHNNPVRAGLATDPDAWAWSSHREYSGSASPGLTDVGLLGGFMRGCEEGSRNDEFEPWPRSEAAPPLLRQRSAATISLDALASGLFPDSSEALRSGSRLRTIVEKKAIMAGKAVLAGHSLVSIAAWMNCTPPAVHRLLGRNK